MAPKARPSLPDWPWLPLAALRARGVCFFPQLGCPPLLFKSGIVLVLARSHSDYFPFTLDGIPLYT